MRKLITVEIDGLPTDVDAEEWGADPDSVIEKVHTARQQVSDLSGIHDPADWDYDSLVDAFGEDDQSEVAE